MQCGDAEVTKLSASVLRPKNNVNLKPKDSVCREDAMRATGAETHLHLQLPCKLGHRAAACTNHIHAVHASSIVSFLT